MRPDEIEGLAGEFKPNLIHEIRCPIGLERPCGYRKMLQQPNLELQLLVGFGKLPCSFRDPPIEFTRDPLLFTQEASLLQPDSYLIGCHTQKQSLRLRREIGALRSGHDDSNFAIDSQPHRKERCLSPAETATHALPATSADHRRIAC